MDRKQCVAKCLEAVLLLLIIVAIWVAMFLPAVLYFFVSG